MGTDDDVDIAIGQALLDQRHFLWRNQAGGLRNVDRKAAEALGEILGVLPRQKRRRHHHGDLLAVEGYRECRAQRHLGLAKADVAADQPVHRPAAFEVLQRGGDGAELVLGFLIGEARAEFVVDMRLHRHFRRFMQMPFGRDLDQFAGNLADPVLQLGLARLPAAATQSVEFDIGVVGAVARQQLDVFHRQEQLGFGGVMQLEAVMRRAADLDGLQADKSPDTVLDMHHEVAGRQTCYLGDEVVELAGGFARPHQAVAQDVLLADDGDIVGLKTAFHADHGQHGLVARCGLHRAPGVDAGKVEQLVVAQHAAHAVARTFAPQRDHYLFALRLQRQHMRHHGFKHVDRGVGTLGSKAAAGARARVDHVGAILGHRERRQPRKCGFAKPFRPFGIGQIEPVRRQRLVDRAAAGMLQRLAPGLVVVHNLLESLARGILGLRLDRNDGAVEIVEQRIHPLLEQRQPMLHAGVTAAFADGFIEQIVALRRAKGRDIAHAKAANGFGDELEFRDRNQIERAHVEQRALGFRIEGADRFQAVAEEVEPHGLVEPGRKQVEDAAAHGIFAGFAHGRGAIVTVVLEPGDDRVHRHDMAGGDRQRLRGNDFARRHPLHDGVDRGQHDQRLVAALQAR